MNPLFRAARRRALVFQLFIFCLLLMPVQRMDAQLIYADSFNYPDGQIDFVPGSPWVVNYEPSNQMSVVSGRLSLSGTNGESIRYDFPDPLNTGALYARMVVNVSKLPAGNGDFFSFFRQSGTDNIRARVWVSSANANLGKFRFGITMILSPAIFIPQDFSPGTNFTLVVRYAITNANTTLWVNPTAESDTSNRVDDTRYFDNLAIQHFGFSQTRPGQAGLGNDMGTLTVDEVRIGRSFEEVMSSVAFKSISNSVGGAVSLRASGQATSNYVFQATTNLSSGNWVNLSTNTASTNGSFNLSDTNATNFPSRFYRLLKQ